MNRMNTEDKTEYEETVITIKLWNRKSTSRIKL